MPLHRQYTEALARLLALELDDGSEVIEAGVNHPPEVVQSWIRHCTEFARDAVEEIEMKLFAEIGERA